MQQLIITLVMFVLPLGTCLLVTAYLIRSYGRQSGQRRAVWGWLATIGASRSQKTPIRTRAREFGAGARAQLPFLIGIAPFGVIYSALATNAGLAPEATQAMSAIVFAGSAQFVATSLFAVAAPWPVIMLTTLIINLRHLWYSASIAPYLAHLPARWKLGLAFLLTDETYALSMRHYAAPSPSPDHRHWYLAGSGLALWLTWQLATAVGVFVGAQVPASWQLDFALPLTFIALLVTWLRDRPAYLAAGIAGLVAVLTAGLPYQLGLVFAAVAGISVGAVARRVDEVQR